MAYRDNGELLISNIMAENAVRPFAVGQRAYTSPRAQAICYSLIEMVKLNDLELFSRFSVSYRAQRR